MKSLRAAAAFAVAAAVMAGAPHELQAQDVQYETVSRVDFAGAMGTAMRVAARLGGGASETVETTYIKGRKMRTDSDGSSTIFDLDAGRFTMLDHEARTYTTFTVEEMVQRAREGVEQAGNRREEMRNTGDEARVDFRFSVDDTGERQRVSGYDAQRFMLTMEMEAEARPEGEDEMQQAGTMVVLTDMWTSRDIPVFQAQAAFEDNSAQRWADAGASITEGFAAAFADDPRVQVAFEQSMEEAKKIDGMTVKSVTHFVTVSPGESFDRNLAINGESESGPSLAQQAGRAAIGGLMGRLGRRAQPEAPAEPAQPKQATLFTVTSEVRNVSTTSLDASLFEVPAGYTEREM